MKVIWEVKDIRPGIRYKRPGSTETWIIGYLSELGIGGNLVAISLIEGMVLDPISPREFAQFLTEQGFVPVNLSELTGD